MQPLRGKDNAIEGAVEIFRDNTAQAEVLRKTEEIRRLAFLDHLTQLPNRRFAEMAIQTAFSEYQVHHSPFAVMMIDVDHLKTINDTCGHRVGDRALQVVGHTLVESLRSSDTVSRWGGDEFLAIVRNVDSENLDWLAHRCVAIVATVNTMNGQNNGVAVSISVGAALIRPDENIQQLVERAGRLNYAGKAAGRNRATIE